MFNNVNPQGVATAPKTPKAALAVQAHDFAPDLLTVQLTPPSRLPRTVLLGLTALVGCMLVWSFFAELDIVATAQGRLVPISYTKVVQPAEAGVVSEILVKDGDAVKAGQVLLRLDARLSQNDLQAQGQDVAIKRMTLARIAAELAGPLRRTGKYPWLRRRVAPVHLFWLCQCRTKYRCTCRRSFRRAMQPPMVHLRLPLRRWPMTGSPPSARWPGRRMAGRSRVRH